MRDTLAAFIRWVMRDTAYHRIFTAVVVAPSGGDTVDLLPDDPSIRGNGLQGVPVSYGLPGAKATFSPGVRMLLFFENGDKTKPRAICFEGSHLTMAFGGGVQAIARVGDSISFNGTIVGTAAAAPPVAVTGTCSGTGMIIAGAPTVTA